ncbi:hypothetical protein LCGC14_2339190 [marine sediment metagenome]|uniref:Uncharacterized protein n=1 Tax=marine sediment metagenome TaxID=412755 RepID=A0A0F9CDC1_9ZZZZ
MVWALCTSGQAITKAGVNANSTITASGQALSNWSDETESAICSVANKNVVSNFSGLTANGKEIMAQLASDIIGQQIINYDMSGYTSRHEATMMLNVLENRISKNKAIIKESDNKAYLGLT